eukprot:TRINITY_DN6155_c0_g1_i2.p1 TRINITY_DN6155_c0_g1~~TRINITY_DN6155_c0_g1_i2.p1  ORF type:complete len:222 (-),score=31.76 TRINITY_DN6155_c0_g1_i2:204-869(-)
MLQARTGEHGRAAGHLGALWRKAHRGAAPGPARRDRGYVPSHERLQRESDGRSSRSAHTWQVAHLVEGHVLAKRYLCYKEPEYYEKLSPASKVTLAFQGGHMSQEEAVLFEQGQMFETCKLMRTWDEKAKRVGLEVPGLESYKERCADNLLIASLCSPRAACRVLQAVVSEPMSAVDTTETSSFIRDGGCSHRLVESGQGIELLGCACWIEDLEFAQHMAL